MKFKDLDKNLIKVFQGKLYEYWNGSTDKTLGEVEKEIEDILCTNNLDISTSAVRKNIKAKYDLLSNIDEEEINDELSKKAIDLEVCKHKLQRDKLFFNREKRNIFDLNMLLDKYIDSLELNQFNVNHYPLKPIDKKKCLRNFILGDLHIGELTESQHKLILQHVFNNIKEYKNVELTFVGDNIEGLLHTSQLQNLKMSVVEQVLITQNLLSEFIINVAQHTNLHKVRFIDEDNHGEIRPLKSGRGDFPNENLNKIISETLRRVCEELNIEYISAPTITDNGYTYLHGDQFRSLKAIEKASSSLGKIVCGHFHEYTNNGVVISCPALVTSGAYANSLGYFDKPKYLIQNNDSFELKTLDIDLK